MLTRSHRLATAALSLMISLVALSCRVIPPLAEAPKSHVPPPWVISAAAGKVDITPDPAERDVWIAGFGVGRGATGIHDRLYARALYLDDGFTRIAIVGVDLIGIFNNDVLKIRASIDPAARLDYLLISATHNHEGPDTMGLWGPAYLLSGVDKEYMAHLRVKIKELIEELARKASPAILAFSEVAAPVEGYVRDGRDPVVIDNTLSVMRVDAVNGGGTIATVVNWANHPETLGSDNTFITADYVGFLCDAVEARTGGTCVFLSGALGGMMTPELISKNGVETRFAEAERIGEGIAQVVLEALKKAERSDSARIRVETREVLVPVQNRRYHIGMRLGVLDRPVFKENGSEFSGPIHKKNIPHAKTEVAVIDIGDAQFVTIPGELFPEFAVGGYEGSRSFHHEIIAGDNPNPPDLSKSPPPPYLRDMMTGRYGFIVGLANDELGYILPEYDFQINMDSPIHEPEPPGDHYEETNSCGIKTASRVLGALREILEARTPLPPIRDASEKRD